MNHKYKKKLLIDSLLIIIKIDEQNLNEIALKNFLNDQIYIFSKHLYSFFTVN